MPTQTPTPMVTHQVPGGPVVVVRPDLERADARELNDRLFAAWSNTFGPRPLAVVVWDRHGMAALDLAAALALLAWESAHGGLNPYPDGRWVPSQDARKMHAVGQLGLDGSVQGGMLSDGRQARVVTHLRDLPGLVRELAADQTWED